MDQNDSISKLEARAEQLRAEISAMQKNLEEMTTLIVLMKKYLQYDAKPVRVTSQVIASAVAVAAKQAAGETKHQRIVRTTDAVLADGRRRLSRQLVVELRERGVEVGGKDEAARLASYLSHEKYRYQSDVKAGGWTLRRLLKQARPGEAPTSTGLSFNGSVATTPQDAR